MQVPQPTVAPTSVDTKSLNLRRE